VLRHAEDQLGYLLFDRVKGKLVPTSEGRQLYKEVSKLYDNLDSIRRLAENLGQMEKGVIRVAITPALGLNVIPEAVAAFIDMHPDVRFEIETLHHGEIVTSLLERKIDLGIAFDPSSHPDIHERIMRKGEFVCLAPKDEELPDKKRILLSDLEGRKFISLNGRGPLGRLLMAQVENSGVELDVIANVETYHIAKTLVSLGTGLAIVDDVTAFSNKSENVQVRKMTPPIDYSVTALHLKNQPVPLICQKFLDHVEENLAEFLKG